MARSAVRCSAPALGRVRVRPLVAGLALVLSVLPAGRAQGYSHGGSWDPELWPPGTTMSITLVDSEAWRERYSDIGEVRRILQAALDLWAEVPNADIRWEIGEILSEAEFEARGGRFGGLISVRGKPFGRFDPSGAYISAPWVEDDAGELTQVVRDCDVELVVFGEGLFQVAVHEFGHCLSLLHAEVYLPRNDYSRSLSIAAFAPNQDSPPYWVWDPVMTYGRQSPDPRQLLTADDRIGAAVVRPAAGWLEERSGSIVGRVTLPDGTPVQGAYVLATRLLEPESASYSVGRLTWRTGEFEIEGLPPGDYQLLVRSPSGIARGWLYWDEDVVLDLRQTLRAGPVRVRAGEESGPVPLAVRRWVEGSR